jgi:hypothetical protein
LMVGKGRHAWTAAAGQIPAFVARACTQSWLVV